MLNPHLILVIDNFPPKNKSPFLTEQIESMFFDKENSKYKITFKSGNEFQYNEKRIAVLENPIHLNPQKIYVSRNEREFSNVSDIFEFEDKNASRKYWHIVFENGKERTYDFSDLQIEMSALDDQIAKNTFEYIKALASASELKSEDDENILLKSYNKIAKIKTTCALGLYLNPGNLKPKIFKCDNIIFPFGCNSSQIKAVQNALSNQISIISGPPGTGKTQTILNIIANILAQGKTVQVVSNNNDATSNVLEKLKDKKYSLDFVAANLGRKKNKESFIDEQKSEYPKNLGEMKILLEPLQKEKLSNLFSKLKGIFKVQEELANARAELEYLCLEREHFEAVHNCKVKIRKNLSAKTYFLLWHNVQEFSDKEKEISFFLKLKIRFKYGIGTWSFFKNDSLEMIEVFKNQFYAQRQIELESKICKLEEEIKRINAKETLNDFSKASLEYLKFILAKRYDTSKARVVFTEEDLYKNYEMVQKEYPLILSTTFSSRNSLNPNAEFDYVIMDEASQVDIATGCLALSNAKNAVIVGDLKQLPNVVTQENKIKLESVMRDFSVDESYNSAKYSFLESLKMVVPEIPETLLREHYRCSPKIIGFCNQKFYGGKLLVMTEDKTGDAISVLKTVQGNHARGKTNLRQAEEIQRIVLEESKNFTCEQIGIIAPYNAQVDLLKTLVGDKIDVSTVHKFQGREKDFIIISTVDNVPTEFSDDPNLLNVAVSRAKKRLVLVTSDESERAMGNVAELISYIKYNSEKIENGTIRSVFDYLYTQFNEARREFLKGKKRISQFDSENLFYTAILDFLENEFPDLGVLCHTPLREIIDEHHFIYDAALLKYAMHPWTHIDFLIYSKVSKLPILAIEIDGWHFHSAKNMKAKMQAERDKMKDEILRLCKIPLQRLTTNGSEEIRKIREKLKQF